MSPTIEKVPLAATKVQDEHSAGQATLNIAVVFTSIESTLSALRKAASLASGLHACIMLIVPQVVPYPLPLTSPPVSPEFTTRQFRVLTEQSPVETTTRIYLCRDRLDTLLQVLEPHSLVVVGGRRRWWPTADELLARQLRRVGHKVVFAEA